MKLTSAVQINLCAVDIFQTLQCEDLAIVSTLLFAVNSWQKFGLELLGTHAKPLSLEKFLVSTRQ